MSYSVSFVHTIHTAVETCAYFARKNPKEIVSFQLAYNVERVNVTITRLLTNGYKKRMEDGEKQVPCFYSLGKLFAPSQRERNEGEEVVLP